MMPSRTTVRQECTLTYFNDIALVEQPPLPPPICTHPSGERLGAEIEADRRVNKGQIDKVVPNQYGKVDSLFYETDGNLLYPGVGIKRSEDSLGLRYRMLLKTHSNFGL